MQFRLWYNHPVSEIAGNIPEMETENSIRSFKLPSVLGAMLSVSLAVIGWQTESNVSGQCAMGRTHGFSTNHARVRLDYKIVRWIVGIQITSNCSRSLKEPAAILRHVIH